MRFAAAAAVALALAIPAAADAAPRARLSAFGSCKDLVNYARAGAERTDGTPGVAPQAVPAPVDAVVTPPLIAPVNQTTTDMPTAVSAPAAAPTENAAGGTAGTDFSGTNTQEVDVDEPDIIKTDGKRIFAVTDRTLRVVDVATGTVTGTLALDGYGHRLLLRGNRILAIGSKGGYVPPINQVVAPACRSPRCRRRSRRRRRPSPRSTSRAPRRSCARWTCPAASSTRARTAAPPGW